MKLREEKFHRELSKKILKEREELLNDIPYEYRKPILDLYLEDKIDMLMDAISDGEIADGYIFVVSDLFTAEEWKFFSIFPGNMSLGRRFKYIIDNNNLPIKQITSEWGSKYQIDTNK